MRTRLQVFITKDSSDMRIMDYMVGASHDAIALALMTTPPPPPPPPPPAPVFTGIVLSNDSDYLNLGSGTSLSFLVRFLDGADTGYFGGGNDQGYGGAGEDWLYGRNGNDRLDGGSEDDRLDGGNGNDTLIGGTGSDELIGGKGVNAMNGGAGNDDFSASGLLDIMRGGTGHDYFYMVGVEARAYGDDGNDFFNLIAGKARAEGGAGDDTFAFGGNAVVRGDGGSDFFLMSSDYGNIVGMAHILDFNPDEGDKLSIRGYDMDQVRVDPRHADRIFLTDDAGNVDTLNLHGYQVYSVESLNQQDWFSADWLDGGKG